LRHRALRSEGDPVDLWHRCRWVTVRWIRFAVAEQEQAISIAAQHSGRDAHKRKANHAISALMGGADTLSTNRIIILFAGLLTLSQTKGPAFGPTLLHVEQQNVA